MILLIDSVKKHRINEDAMPLRIAAQEVKHGISKRI